VYNWRSKNGGLEVSDLAKLRQPEDENRRLKKLVADQTLNIEALRIVAEETSKACSAQTRGAGRTRTAWGQGTNGLPVARRQRHAQTFTGL
jgi:hypothetical protein